MNTEPSQVPERGAGLRIGMMALRAALWGALLPLTLVLLLWLTLRWGIWPQLDRWKEPIAAHISKRLGVPVHLAGVYGGWDGVWPTLEVASFAVGDPNEPLLTGRLLLIFGPDGLRTEGRGGGALSPRWELAGQWYAGDWVLELTAESLQLLPLAEVLAETGWATAQPTVSVLTGTFRGRGETLDRVSVRFSALSWLASADFPGLSGLDGWIEGGRDSGEFALAAPSLVAQWPADWFAEPALPLKDFVWQGQWRYAPGQGYELITEHLSARQGQMQLAATGRLRGIGRGLQVWAESEATLTQVPLPMLTHYLPPAAVGETTIQWLAQAFVAGTVPAAQFSLHGPLDAFPFSEEEGTFAVTLPVRDVRLRYDAEWPEVFIHEGLVQFRNASLIVEVPRARSERLEVRDVRTEIPRLDAPETVLTVALRASGRWPEVLNFAAKTPLKTRLPLAQWRALSLQADTELDLYLTLPLDRNEFGVQGELRLRRGSVPAQVAGLPINRLEAVIGFDHAGLRLANAQARWGEVPVKAQWLGGDPPKIELRALVPGEALTRLAKLPAGTVSGNSEVVATVTLIDRWRVEVQSSLTGMRLGLPAPLDKAPSERWPLTLTLQAGEPSWYIEASVGDRVRYRQEASGAWAVAVGDIALPAPKPFGAVALRAETLDAEAWRRWAEALTQRPAASWPEVRLAVRSLRLLQRDWHEGQVQMLPRPRDRFELSIEAQEVRGKGVLQRGASGLERVELELAHVHWPAAVSQVSEALSRSSFSPRDWPQLRISVLDLRWEGRALGRLRLAGGQQGATWQLREGELHFPVGTRVRAKGQWEAAQTQLQLIAEVADLGKWLQIFDLTGVEGGQGTLTVELSWPGAPTDFALKAVRGSGTLAFRDGTFEEIEPGVGRLLSLFNLGTLLRRLRFDFRDVAQKGLMFDSLSGSFALAEGYLATSDLTIDAPVALVQLAGAVDTYLQTQEFEVRIVPRLGSTAATALAFVNPVAGILALLGQQVVGDPIGRLMMQRYRISGSWEAPTVERLDVAPTPREGAP